MVKQKMKILPSREVFSYVVALLRLWRSGSDPFGIRFATDVIKKYWLVAIFVLAFLLRLPSLFEPFTYGDEGVYLTLGQAIRRGLILYRDIHDNKPPLLYLIAALAGSFSYFRLILFIWSLVTIYFFKKLAELILKQKGVIISTLTFAILSSIHTFEGNVANAENFLIGTSILGFYLLFRKKNVPWAFFVSGVFFSLSTLFKVPGVFDFLAALVIVFILERENLKTVFESLISPGFYLFILGFTAPIVLSLAYFYLNGALKEYLIAAFSQNIPYLSSWSTNRPQLVGFPLPLILRVSFVLVVILLLFALRKRLAKVFLVSACWFAFSLFAALLSSRPYPHYLLQTIPSLSLAFGLLTIKTKEKLLPIVSLATIIFTFVIFKFYLYLNCPYYLNFYQYLFQLKDKASYFSSFDTRTNNIYQTASFIKVRTLENEPLFIWSNQPSLYALANRPIVGRYSVAYHIIDFNGFEETIIQLKKQSPHYIIVDQEEKRPFLEFFNLLERKYALEKQTGNFQIYHRIF